MSVGEDGSSSSDEYDSDQGNENMNGFTADLGHVAAFDTTPVDPSSVKKNGIDVVIREMATENMKLMFRDLMMLPKSTESQTIVELPQSTFRLPRFKPIPKPKPETKWEKFAREKGIDNRKKRDRMVWDDETQTWAPRFGYGRHTEGGAGSDWCVELSDGDDDTVDKFKQRKDQKKLRVLKNRAKFLRNQERQKKKETVLDTVENLNVEGSRAGASKRGLKKISKSLESVQVSTASLGRFDAVMADEPSRPRLGNKKRKFESSETVSELSRDKKILERLLGKHLGKSKASPAASGGSKKKKKGSLRR